MITMTWKLRQTGAAPTPGDKSNTPFLNDANH